MKKYTNKIILLFLIACFSAVLGNTALAQNLTPDEVVQQLEKRYTNQGFTANFMQQSTIRALQITDFAEGRLAMVYPGKMRWEYTQPEKQLIIANNNRLWVYRPADNQVMVGDPRDFFSIGKGGSFLSDITSIRKNFKVSFLEDNISVDYILRLVPIKQHQDIAEIFLSIARGDFRIYQISTINHYGDTTDIELLDIVFTIPNDSNFNFEIPAGTDVVRLDN